jgi:hypothetical protein
MEMLGLFGAFDMMIVLPIVLSYGIYTSDILVYFILSCMIHKAIGRYNYDPALI